MLNDEKTWVYGSGFLFIITGVLVESRDFYLSYWIAKMFIGAGGGVMGVNFMNRYQSGENHPDERDMEINKMSALRSFQFCWLLTGILTGVFAFTDISMPGVGAFSMMFLVLSLVYVVSSLYYQRRM